MRTLCTEYPNVLCHSAGDYMDDRKAMETQDKASTCLSSAGDNTANAQQLLCTLKDGTYWKISTSQNYNIRPKVYQAKGQKDRYCKPEKSLAWFQTAHVIWPC